MIKTIWENEFQLLFKILPDYYRYIIKYPQTYMSRFYGLHRLKCYNKNGNLVKNICIIVMNNVFDKIESPELIHNKYDLKGSTYKRKSNENDKIKGNPKKDLDFLNEKKLIKISEGKKKSFLMQLE